ncbi:MAG: hypothetical protein HY904_20545 [Deltaproteobacteria bacterium]|nr:hypothetical protein [Deltaproteobacteria bacterium]
MRSSFRALLLVAGSLSLVNCTGDGSSSSSSSSGGGSSSSSSSSGGSGSSGGTSSSSGGSSGAASSGSSGGALVAEEGSCVTDTGDLLECAAGLECISDSTLDPSYGACKKLCTGNADCTGGKTCVIGFLSDTEGVCASPVGGEGSTGCQFWEEGPAFCWDAADLTGSFDAYLECVNGTCAYVCNYEGSADPAYSCPSGKVCGSTFTDVAGYSDKLAVCEVGSASSSGGVASSASTTGSSAAAASSAAPSSSIPTPGSSTGGASSGGVVSSSG